MLKIIEKTNLALLFVFIVACSSFNNRKDITKEFNDIYPEFVPYIEDFVSLVEPHYYSDQLSSLSVGKKDIVSDKGNIAGLCKFLGFRKNVEIVIHSPFWQKADKYEKEALMLHELGHCLCNIQHTHLEGNYDPNFSPFDAKNASELLKNGYLEDLCPSSVMSPYIISSYCYKKHRLFYRQNLRIKCYSSIYYGNKISNAEKNN